MVNNTEEQTKVVYDVDELVEQVPGNKAEAIWRFCHVAFGVGLLADNDEDRAKLINRIRIPIVNRWNKHHPKKAITQRAFQNKFARMMKSYLDKQGEHTEFRDKHDC